MSKHLYLNTQNQHFIRETFTLIIQPKKLLTYGTAK